MKRVKLFLISLVTLVTLSVGFSSCGGSVGKISEMFKVESEYYGDQYGVTYKAKVKNTSNRTLEGSFRVKVKCKDGTSTTETAHVVNMEPGEIQEITIYNNAIKTYNVSSWSFVDE